MPLPQGPSVFVHGDLWQGNTLWNIYSFVGMIDWDAAGPGHPGIDLGTLRCDAAIVFGLPAAAEILAILAKRRDEFLCAALEQLEQ